MIYPALDGGSIASLNIAKGLSQVGNQITVLAMNTPKHSFDVNKIPTSEKQNINFHTINIDTSVKPIGAIVALLKNESYNISRFNSKEYKQKLIELLTKENFDIVQLEGLFLAPYINTIRKHSKAKIALRAHNVEYIIWERLATKEINPLKKFYLNILAKQLKRYEIEQLKKIDILLPITEIDANHFSKFGYQKSLLVLPASFDENKYQPNNSKVEPKSLFFIGRMDWKPNAEGLWWFIKNVLHEVLKKYPELKFYIAGRNMSSDIKNLNSKNIVAIGEVEDAIEFMISKSIMICPLFSGSGMRVKIIEAMALGKTIISTSIGAEGIPCKSEENILLADTANDFQKAILRCIEDTSLFGKIGENALSFAHRNYGNKETTDKLINFYSAQLGVNA